MLWGSFSKHFCSMMAWTSTRTLEGKRGGVVGALVRAVEVQVEEEVQAVGHG